jgi:hypothetical protein
MSFPIGPFVTYGAHPGEIAGNQITGGIAITDDSGDAALTTAVGEADELAGRARGGGNTVTCDNGAPHGSASAVGDALTVSGQAQAGHNTVTVSGSGEVDAAGDAVTLSGAAQGGHNSVAAFCSRGVNAYGDAYAMTDHATGGHNAVTGQSALDVAALYGDAYTLSGSAAGGHNTVTAVGTSVMYGDAYQLADHASGGGNLLIGPAHPAPLPMPPVDTLMYGDGYALLGAASGGGNTLVSGQASNETMWGDAAIVSPTAHTRANTFEFGPQNGHDTVMDFHPGEDHIALQGLGVSSFAQLSPHLQQTAGGVDIVFDADNDILLHGVSQVTGGDFLFA